MKRLRFCLTIWAVVAVASGEANLVRNPSFEVDADRDGVPDDWQAAGSSGYVEQTLSLDTGRDDKSCARLVCSRFRDGSPAAHAMLCQLGVPVRRGTTYRVVLWARAQALAGDVVSIALSDTSDWASCGLSGAFVPSPDWKRFEFFFRATRNCPTASRFQIWFHSTGTLWVDDVEFAPAAPDTDRPGHVITPGDRVNRVPNASFECGTDGWGSAEWDRTTHWGGRMNRLFGTLDKNEAFHGHCSLRIDLTPKTQPVSFFDYFDLHRTPINAPLAANIGFIEVEPGRTYTVSVYLKAAAANTPARLAVRQFTGRHFEKPVRVSQRWERHTLTFTPAARWCYVLAGPDLRKTEENPNPPPRATVWLDAVQLEKGRNPSAFLPREPVEIGVWTDRLGNVFGSEEPVRLRLAAAASAAKEHRVRVSLRLTDFFDKEVWRNDVDLSVPAGGRIEREIVLEPSDALRGFLRLHLARQPDGGTGERTMRLAVVPLHRADDSRFGVNHAYPWPHLLDLSRKSGLLWVRDWSLKWKDVEPEKGRFTFGETDFQIDRPISHGLRLLCMLPFPSSPWSSSAPPDTRRVGSYEQRRAVVARAPRDMAEFENYVQRSVDHYRDRVTWFQVFNEPLFTQYALPRKHGYDGATYAQYVKAFARAARRADPRCQILAGIGGLRDGQIMDDFERFFAAGGLNAIDALDIHHYPRIRPPEFVEDLLETLNALMDKHGGRKPIWLTEYGYYADDEPWVVPMPNQGFNQPLPSERVQAEYAVRWAVILFANGVEKIFYHAGTCAGINGDSLQGVFYEYGGEPHKIYAAQAVMAGVFPTTCRFVKRLGLGDKVKGYLFRDGTRLVAVVWATPDAGPKTIRLGSEKLVVMDIMGRQRVAREFTPSGTPLYVFGEDLTPATFEAALVPATAAE